MHLRSQEEDRVVRFAGGVLRSRLSCYALLLCATALCAQTNAHEPQTRQPSSHVTLAGRQSFESSCAPCHGLNGRGGERAPDIATRLEVTKLSDSETLKVLRDGILQKGMPPFGSLGTAKLSEVLRYLRLLQGKRAVVATPMSAVNAAQGKEVFNNKGGCSQCHMIHGVGGFLGPNLSDYGSNHSVESIRSAIVSAEKRPVNQKGLARTTIKDGRQISGLVRNEDNFSVQLQALDGTFYLLEKSSLAELKFDSAPVMPADYGSKLTKEELDQLVTYLVSVGDAKQ